MNINKGQWLFIFIILAITTGIVVLGIKMTGSDSKNNFDPSIIMDKPVPVFFLKGAQDEEYSSDNLKGKKVILFFNEGLACYPACWDQMTKLAEDERFNNQDTVAISVVPNDLKMWQKAVEGVSALGKIKVALDTGGSVSKTFGMLNVKSSMHPGSPGHSYVILDREGIVRFVFDDPKMGINNEKLYEEIAKLK